MAATNYTPIQLYFSTTASAVPLAANLAQGELAINITDGKLYYEDNAGVVQVIATKGAGTIGGSTTQIQYNNAGALAGNAAMTFNSGTNTTTLTTLNLTNALGAIYGGTSQSAYAQGDFLYASATNTLSKLSIGTVNYILTSTGTVPQWVAPTSITVNTATNLAGGAGGSVPYQSAADTTTFLAIGTANRVMTSSGTAPQWVTALTGLTGVSSSSITNTSLTSGRVVYSGASGVETDSASLTFNGTTLSAGGFSTTGLSTLVQTVKIGDSNFSGTAVFAAATPAKLYIGTGTVTDTTSAIGATNATGAISSLAITPIAATNTSVTYTNASTLYIAGAPSAGTNITITNPYSLYVAGGASYFGGAVDFAVTPSYSGGTANGVMYLNGSKEITTGTALTFSGSALAVNGSVSGTATNTWTIQSVAATGSLVDGGWFYGGNGGLNLSPNGSGLLKRLTISYFTGSAYSEAIGISNVNTGVDTGTLSLMGNTASLTSAGLQFGVNTSNSNVGAYSILAAGCSSGNGNGGTLTIKAGSGSGSGTNGSLYLLAGTTNSPGSITTGGSVFISTGQPSTGVATGNINFQYYTGATQSTGMYLQGTTGYLSVGAGASTPTTFVSVGGATDTNFGYSIAPNGWNSAKHRLTVPTSGDTSVWSFNYNGSAVDFSGYTTASISVGGGQIVLKTAEANTAPKTRFSVNYLGPVGFGTQGTTADRLLDMSFQGATISGANQYGLVLNPTYPTSVSSSLFNIYAGPNLTAGTTVTNVYGLYLEGINATGSTVTNRYGIFQSSSSDINFFNGNLGVGTTDFSSYSNLFGVNRNQNSATRALVNNQANNASASAELVLASYGNSWVTGIGSSLKNGNALTWALDATAATPSVKMALDASGNLDLPIGGALLTLNRGQYTQQTKFYQDTGGTGAQYETTNPSVNAQYYAHIFKGTNNVPTTVEYGRFNQWGLGLGGANPSSGIGVTFPATQSASSNANTLDDYEEGTFTPFFTTDSGTYSVTYTTQTGRYTKVGRIVQFQFYIAWSAFTGTGNVVLNDLPFAFRYRAGAIQEQGFTVLFSSQAALIGNAFGQDTATATTTAYLWNFTRTALVGPAGVGVGSNFISVSAIGYTDT